MNIRLKLFLAVAVTSLSVISCSKNGMFTTTDADDSIISVAVSADIEDIVPADQTKASVAPVIRLSWADGDKVFVYDGTQSLGTLEVALKNSDSRYAYLEGEINAPVAGTTVLTCVYAKGFSEAPVVNEGKIKFSLNEQSGSATPFVITGTIPYSGQTAIADQLVNFTFATGVVFINCIDLVNETINKAWVKGVNTACELTLSGTAAPTAAGTDSGNISTTGVTGGNSKLSYYVGMPITARASSGRKLLIEQQTKVMESSFTSSAFNKGAFSSVMYKVVDAGPVIVINGLKWAKQNLAISASGNMKWKGGNDTAVKVPGTDEDVINGDYFQWAAYPGYCGSATDPDKGLLIYTSFTNKYCVDGGTTQTFTCKKQSGNDYVFHENDFTKCTGIVPYYDKSLKAYTKYTDSSLPTLESSDDVASIILGGSWRMPTRAEFQALKEATYWAWDATDMGSYVYAPQEGDAGKWNDLKAPGHSYSKTDALLFFPASGYGCLGTPCNVGSLGNNGTYWSSNSHTSNQNVYYAYYFNTTTSDPNPDYASNRYYGRSIRPVSD